MIPDQSTASWYGHKHFVSLNANSRNRGGDILGNNRVNVTIVNVLTYFIFLVEKQLHRCATGVQRSRRLLSSEATEERQNTVEPCTLLNSETSSLIPQFTSLYFLRNDIGIRILPCNEEGVMEGPKILQQNIKHM